MKGGGLFGKTTPAFLYSKKMRWKEIQNLLSEP
jgi:hypothetical protein